MLFTIGIYFSEQVWTEIELISCLPWQETPVKVSHKKCTWRYLAQVHLFPQGINRIFMHTHASYILCPLPHQSYGCIFKYLKTRSFGFFSPGVHVLWVNTDPNVFNALPLISVGSGFQTILSICYHLLCCKETKASSKFFVWFFFPQSKKCLQTSSN